MYLVDTNAISELRKGANADAGVVRFFEANGQEIFLPVFLVGELRSGTERLKRRGDLPQAQRLESWLEAILLKYRPRIISFDLACAQAWGYLMGVNDQHIVDRQIAAMSLVYDLTVVTRNTSHFAGTGVRLLNPFAGDAAVAGPAPGKAKPRKTH